QREREEILAVAARHLVERLLPIIDDFSRALAAADESRDFDTLRAGVAMIEQKLAEVLRAEGVEPIEALHQPFDPHWHEALMVEEDDTAADNTVVEVYQKGYKMGGRLLRPSLVRVARSGRQE
ncbi:MAG: nucleotide exchange factor GrpE, partial [Syntrophomonadaceae bacterium]|nr:nucleotide exchange factor GrpE [Syntrophomonadaceae bacterium]